MSGSMTAFRLLHGGRPAEYQEVAIPVPGADEVLIAVRAAGLCRTDLGLLAGTHDGARLAPFTLGHEIAGRVVRAGAGVDPSLVEARVVVSAMYYCGRCTLCARGSQSVCRDIGVAGYGVGIDGGIADYVVAKARHVVDIGGLAYPTAAPLADAAATTYHAVRSVRPVLVPGAVAVVIGIGGLGAFAVQWLTQMPGVHVVAVDRAGDKLALAKDLGASELVSDKPGDTVWVDELRSRADVVLDLVGTDETLLRGLALIRGGGRLVVAGIGGGRVAMGWDVLPRNGQFINTRGYDLPDLLDVVRLAELGLVSVPHVTYRFDDVERAIDDLAAGRVAGRAVLVRDDTGEPQGR